MNLRRFQTVKISYNVYTDSDGLIYAECSDSRFNIPPMTRDETKYFILKNEHVESVHLQDLIAQLKNVLPIGFLKGDN